MYLNSFELSLMNQFDKFIGNISICDFLIVMIITEILQDWIACFLVLAVGLWILYTVDGRPSFYCRVFLYLTWCRISSINRMTVYIYVY